MERVGEPGDSTTVGGNHWIDGNLVGVLQKVVQHLSTLGIISMGRVGIEEIDVNALAAVHNHRLFGVEVVLEDISHLEPVLDGPFDIREGISLVVHCVNHATDRSEEIDET